VQAVPLKTGWLKKKSPKGLLAKAWQARFFVLHEDYLYYYKDEPPTKTQMQTRDLYNPTGAPSPCACRVCDAL
jgi:hypothetical protein